MKRRLVVLVALAAVSLLLMAAVTAQPRRVPLAVHTVRADDAMLRRVKELGATHIVQVYSWHDIQPSPARWEWEYMDWLARAAEHYDLEIVARLDKPPAWAVDDATALNAPPRRTGDYAEFARRVAERYRGRVAAYIVWNEPNLAIEWGNEPPDAKAYVDLLRAASESIRAADPKAMILAAGLAPTNENSEQATDDRAYLRAMYAAGARDAFDALVAHPYAFANSPDAPRDANAGLNFARILDLRDVMVENGDADKAIWITEFGYPTEQPEGYGDRVVSEQQQADYIARAFDKTRTELPFVELFTVWNIVRDLPLSDEQSGYTLIRPDGSLKPAFERVRGMDKDGLVALPELSLQSLDAPRELVMLAPDVIVHLGDSEYPAPFVPLYKTRNPAVEWKGEFYMEGVDSNADWALRVELMQVNDFDTRVWVNDVPLDPFFVPAEDFSSKWVTAEFVIPQGTLRAGYNAVSIHNGKLLPALQQPGFTWDEFQFRNVVIRRDE